MRFSAPLHLDGEPPPRLVGCLHVDDGELFVRSLPVVERIEQRQIRDAAVPLEVQQREVIRSFSALWFDSLLS